MVSGSSGTKRPEEDPSTPASAGTAAAALRALGVEASPALARLWADPPALVAKLLYRPSADGRGPNLEEALRAMERGAQRPPGNLIPVLPVDDRSLAVVVCQPVAEPAIEGVGVVLRWHLGDVPGQHQLAMIDTDVELYVESYAQESQARGRGFSDLRKVSAAYRRDFVIPGIRPNTYVTRPVRLACQNVIIGLAAFAHESTFDGLRVPFWQTCEASHVATHEGNRTLAALMLCDAFQCGGTMEIRFDGRPEHPERRVPASLRRYARTRGIAVGEEDPWAITPSEARALFLAVTPMAAGLERRVAAATAQLGITPERACFMLLAGVWSEIELDFVLACSGRVRSILSGGADPAQRATRMAESEACRAALLCGMFFRRLESVDSALTRGEATVFEDAQRGSEWAVVPEAGAVAYRTPNAEVIPWQETRADAVRAQRFLCLPRAHPTTSDVDAARQLQERHGVPTFLIVPADHEMPRDSDLPVLVCPDRVADLDRAIEQKLLSSRVGRA